MAARYHLHIRIGENELAPEHRLFGRVAWTLVQLRQAGDRGVSPIRGSRAQAVRLRFQASQARHHHRDHRGAAWRHLHGRHARCVLRTPIKILELSDPGHSATQSVGAFAEATP
jgi:hypothetical protein